MPCYRPIKGYWARQVNPTGKRSIVFNKKLGFVDQPVDVPCGQCIGCRLERSRQWAIRCVHEASLYEDNCFITLTFSNEYIPEDNSLDKTVFQRFMKRLRKEVSSKKFGEEYGRRYKKVRFFHCGEYGEELGRPHYHACIFNFDFPDKKKTLINGKIIQTSELLGRLWPYGYHYIGEVNFESAAYVARYITKKIIGKDELDHYLNKETGLIKEPEYITMSRRPGIGAGWFEKFNDEIYGQDSIVIKRGDRYVEMRPPKFYDSILEKLDNEKFKEVKMDRKEEAESYGDIEKELYRIERVKNLMNKRRKRIYEQETDVRNLRLKRKNV